jgi:hypothetical protein
MPGEKPASATPIVIVEIVFPRLHPLLPTPAKAFSPGSAFYDGSNQGCGWEMSLRKRPAGLGKLSAAGTGCRDSGDQR